MQVLIDEAMRTRPRAGPLILTGSHSVELMHGITQSPAGRTALLTLLPLSSNELRQAGVGRSNDRLLQAGGYPRIHAGGLDPAVALGEYFATYVEGDLRELIELRPLDSFRRFRRFRRPAAGRVGQLLNMQTLAVDVGVSGHTVRAWLSLLQARFIVRLLPPWFVDIGKRLVKSPKLYFCRTGLAAWLTGITAEDQLVRHPLRRPLFENLALMEFFKHAPNQGLTPTPHHYRDSGGAEVDLVVEHGLAPGGLGLAEVKSGQTLRPEALRPILALAARLGPRVQRRLRVHGGDENHVHQSVEVVGTQA